MKKTVLLTLALLLLTACADKEHYEQAVLAEMKKDKDLKDYKIEPETMTDCVVEGTSDNMPGLFPFDPDRLMSYRNYSKMLSMSSSTDKQKTFEELKKTFNDPQALADAHKNYTSTVVECINIMIERSEPEK